MSEQPEALRLIGQLDEIATYSSKSATWALDAVNELERLYAVNQELVEALKGASNYIDTLGGVSKSYRSTLAKARGEG